MTDFKPGIYLEIKKSTIGTGHTVQTAEYRNFWMTSKHKDGVVQLILLDEDFKLTGITDEVTVSELNTERFKFIPQGEKRFNLLTRQLEERAKKAAEKKAAQLAAQSASTQPEAKPTGWWEQPEKDVKPGDIFKKDDKSQAPGQSGIKSAGAWWEGPKKDIQPGDIFKTRAESAPQKAVAKKKKTTEVVIKKNWWES